MSLYTIGWYTFWIGSLLIFHVATGLLGKKDSLRKKKEQEQSNISKCLAGEDTGPGSANGPPCCCPSPQHSPRSLKPSTPFQLPSSWLGWWDWFWLSCPASCHAKPHGKPPAPQVLWECLSLAKMTEIRVQVPFPKPDRDIFSSFIPLQFMCSGKKTRETKIAFLTGSPSLHLTQMCCVSPSLIFLTFSSLLHIGTTTYLRIKNEPFPNIHCTGFCTSFSSPFLEGSL